mgnify:FL=1
MTTLDMMIKAKEDGKTYRTDDLFYNTQLGFVDIRGKKWQGYAFDYLNDIFAIDTWKQDDAIYMTKTEAESKYGIIIVGD